MIITSLLLASSVSVSTPDAELINKYCEQQYEASEIIMEHRNSSFPLPDLLEMLSGAELFQKIAEIAYRRPKGTDPTEFSTIIYLNCKNEYK